MSDQYLIHCPNCSTKCRSLGCLAQHIAHRPKCESAARPLLAATTTISGIQPTIHHTLTQLDAPVREHDGAPLWPQEDDVFANPMDDEAEVEDVVDIVWKQYRQQEQENARKQVSKIRRVDKAISGPLFDQSLTSAESLQLFDGAPGDDPLFANREDPLFHSCLLYTSDAADE